MNSNLVKKRSMYHGVESEAVVMMAHRNKHLRHSRKQCDNEHIMIFDLDQCLYHAPIVDKISDSIIADIHSKMTGMPSNQVHDESKGLYFSEFMVKKLNYPIDKFCCTVDAVICDCCPEVDALPCDKYIKRSTEVINKLKGIKQRMFLFTNGTKCRAMKILNLIGLEDVFEKVFCADNAECDYIMKPNPLL